MFLHHKLVFLVHWPFVWHRIPMRIEKKHIELVDNRIEVWWGPLTAAQHRKILESTPSDDPRVCCIRDPRQSTVSASRDTPDNRRIHNIVGTRLGRVRHQWYRHPNPSIYFRFQFVMRKHKRQLLVFWTNKQCGILQRENLYLFVGYYSDSIRILFYFICFSFTSRISNVERETNTSPNTNVNTSLRMHSRISICGWRSNGWCTHENRTKYLSQQQKNLRLNAQKEKK